MRLKEQLLINNRYKSKIVENKDDKQLVNLHETEKKIIETLLSEGEKTLEELSILTEIDMMKLVEKLSKFSNP